MKPLYKHNLLGKVDSIYHAVKHRIITTEYAPGEVLNENALASEFSVSRTPVREALRRLQQEHWLVVLPKIGMQVETFDINHFKDLFSTKEALDTLAIQQAAEKANPKDIADLHAILARLKEADPSDFEALIDIDNEIHVRIWAIANNRMLNVYLPDLQERLLRAWLHTRKKDVGINKDLLYGTFVKIIASIEQKDNNLAAEAEREHMDYHREEMRAGLF